MQRLLTLIFLMTQMLSTQAQTSEVVEIRSYNLKPGTRDAFHKVVVNEAIPMLKRWKMTVIDHGPSLHDDNSYFLVRRFSDIKTREQEEDNFYGSEEWKKGPRESILSMIENYTTIVVPASFIERQHMSVSDIENDRKQLSTLNAQFIKNFINEDTVRHNEIIHDDFLCIENDGRIVDRNTYMKAWASDYSKSHLTSFEMGEEHIRLFGQFALVRSKTSFTKKENGKEITGNSIYTDTYIKENGRWRCIQAQITPLKK